MFIKSTNKSKAFTLAETMVVIVLMSIITAAIYSFYSIGTNAHRNSMERLESLSALRFVQKLFLEKFNKRSDGAYNAFLRQDAMSQVTTEELRLIVTGNLSADNQRLYQKTGFASYAAHPASQITDCSFEAISKKMSGFGIKPDEFYGPYLYEVTNETALNGTQNYKILFDKAPSKIYGVNFLGANGNVSVSSNASDQTAEISSYNLKDISSLLGAEPPLNFSLSIEASGNVNNITNIFTFFFFFDQKTPPSISLSQNLDQNNFKKFFIRGSNLFCSDLIAFYESSTDENYINHAFYLASPPAGEENFNQDGLALKNLHYVFSGMVKGKRQCYDETLIKNILSFKLSYYDTKSKKIECPADKWKWFFSPRISSVALEMVISNGGYETPIRLSFIINER